MPSITVPPELSAMRNLGEYVAPDRAVLAATIVEHQD